MTGVLICPEYDETRDGNPPQRRGQFALSYQRNAPVTRKRYAQSSFGEILTKYWKLYCEHASLVGIKYFIQGEATMFGRLLWFFGYSCALYLVFCYISQIYLEYIDTPITTTYEDKHHPTAELQFPSVAVCTINRISRRSLVELAKRMFEANISTLTMNEIYDRLVTLGDLYQPPFMLEKDYIELDQLLSRFYNDQYDVTEIMKSLTPQCSAMFLVCYFRHEVQNCMDLFRFSKTRNGFCCTFNHFVDIENRANSHDNATAHAGVHLVGEVGLRYGLSFSMEPFLDDYSYNVLPTNGWKILIFDPKDYPDPNSGRVLEVLVAPQTEKFIELEALGMVSANVIRSYPREKRGCIFPNEPNSFDVVYSYNECIVTCRLENLWKACKCRPFYYPEYGVTKNPRRTCNVLDNRCLQEYYERTTDVMPYKDKNLMNLIQNNAIAMKCNNCYPQCDDTSYYPTSTSTSVLQPDYYESKLLPKVNVTDQSVVHVYFSQIGTPFLKQDESYRWYEHLSDAGGICGFFIGFSIISLVEIIYFLLMLLAEILGFSFTSTEAKTPDKKIPIQTIHWNEFFPHSRIHVDEFRRNNARY